MTTTTPPHPAGPTGSGNTAAPDTAAPDTAAPDTAAPDTAAPLAAQVGIRRRTLEARLGPLPLVNVVVVQVGLAIGLMLLAVDDALWWAALLILLVAAVLGLGRRRGHWVVHWLHLGVCYQLRSHERVAGPDPATASSASSAVSGTPDIPGTDESVVGTGDQRVALLRLVLPDLMVAHGTDHQRKPLGLAWNQSTWTAVLQVDTAASLITPVGSAPNLPLSALVPCLEDRGVVLDAIQVIWHCYPGSAALPSSSPALSSYLEVLGPLPAAARRTTWIAVRFDPRRCLAAVQERGGGVIGSHRALIGALARVRSTLDAHGVPTRPLNADQLLRAGIVAAELSPVAGTGRQVMLREHWTGVTAAGVGHASYAISAWPTRGGAHNLNSLTGVRALSTTVALAISPGGDGEVGLRGLVRISARNPAELETADSRLHAVSARLGLALAPLHGLQIAGLAATLPLGASA